MSTYTDLFTCQDQLIYLAKLASQKLDVGRHGQMPGTR